MTLAVDGGIRANPSLPLGPTEPDGVMGKPSTDFATLFQRYHDHDCHDGDPWCGDPNSGLENAGRKLAQDGHKLVQEGLQLIEHGDFKDGMRLISEGVRLEQAGGRLEKQAAGGTDPCDPFPTIPYAQQHGSPLAQGVNGNGSHAGSSSGTSPAQLMSLNAQPLSSGGQVQAKQIYQYLIAKYHLTPAQAAGILGNMEVESNLNTGAYNSAEGAIGLCQWEGARRAALQQYANAQGKPVTDWQVQVDFMMNELHGNESGAYSALKSATTPGEAAAAFDQQYERSAGTSHGERIADANSIAAQVG